MKGIHGLVLAAAGLWLLAGCGASGPLFSTMEKDVPSIDPGAGRLFFYRDGSALGAAVTADIKLNGEVVGASQRSSVFFVDRPPGSYTVTCSTEATNEITLALAAGDTMYVRTFVTMGFFVGHVVPELVHAQTGAPAIKDLHYTGKVPAGATGGP